MHYVLRRLLVCLFTCAACAAFAALTACGAADGPSYPAGAPPQIGLP